MKVVILAALIYAAASWLCGCSHATDPFSMTSAQCRALGYVPATADGRHVCLMAHPLNDWDGGGVL